MSASYHKPTSLSEAWSNPRYHGKIVVAAGGEVHGTQDPDKALVLLRRLEKKYPTQAPETTIIPKGGMIMMPQFVQ